MGRSLSPIIKRELDNLDKDADSRRAAMTALNSFVKDLDSKEIPLFLAEVSQKKDAGSLSGEHAISLYEVLARVHGVKIIPFIDNIMDSIIKTLASSAGSFPLQQACSKVVPAIARYGIDMNVSNETKRHIIHSLCDPLLNSLLGSQESLASGAAFCLKALVENDNWRFASYEMVNKVCQNVSGALEESCTQTNAHMSLVMALAKRNAIAVEPYARLLIQAGLQILNGRTEKANSQKRLSSIQMINFLMKSLDPWSICSEIQSIITEMEKCQSDPMAFVKGAALETLQSARRIAEEKRSKIGNGPGSVTGSSYSRDLSKRYIVSSGDVSPASASSLSQNFNSFIEYDSLIGSPILSTQDIQYLDNDSRSMDGKLWSYENEGVVDVSLKDGVLSEIARSSGISNTFSERSGSSDRIVQSNGNHEEEFLGFSQTKPRRGISRSATSSPIRSRTPVRLENDIYRTPRNHVYSLRDANNMNLASSERPPRWSRNHYLNDFERSPVSRCEQNCILPNGYEWKEWRDNGRLYTDVEQFLGSNGSVSSMEGIPAVTDQQETQKVIPKKENNSPKVSAKLVCGLSIALLAVVAPIAWLSSQEEGYYLVPT